MAVSFVRCGLRAAMRSALEISAPCSSIAASDCYFAAESKPYINSRLPLNLSTISAAPLYRPFPTAMVISSRHYSKSSRNERQQDSDSDSDSDDEDNRRRRHQNRHNREQEHHLHQERGDSEFWRRKMRTLHGILDVNNDGVISFDDYLLLAKKFSDLGHLTPKEYEEFIQVMKQTWEEQWGEISPYNLVTAEQFLVDMHHALNDKDLIKKVHLFLPYIFKAVDIHHCDHIELDQFKLFFRCLGRTEEDAAVAFAIIDQNGDGKLTLKEFVKLGKDFFLTEDERRVSKMFWGPLITDH